MVNIDEQISNDDSVSKIITEQAPP